LIGVDRVLPLLSTEEMRKFNGVGDLPHRESHEKQYCGTGHHFLDTILASLSNWKGFGEQVGA